MELNDVVSFSCLCECVKCTTVTHTRMRGGGGGDHLSPATLKSVA